MQRTESEKTIILDAPVEHMMLLDRSMTVVWPNRAACESAGMTREELIGRRCFEIWNDRSAVCPDCPVQEAMKTGADRESARETPDGRAWYVRGFPVRDEAGNVVGAVEITRDVTGQRQAEMRETTALDDLKRFKASVSQGPAVIFRWRIAPESWPVEMVTENVRQFGYEADEFLSGRASWPGMTHEDDIPRLEKEVAGFLERGEDSFVQEYRLITKAGDVRWVADRNTVIKDRDGNPTHIQGIVLDITEQKRLESFHKEQEERLRRLAAKLAKAQDEEQRRISEGLHGDVCQLLTACGIRMKVASNMEDRDESRAVYDEVAQWIREANEKIHLLSFELTSSILYSLGLAHALEELCSTIERRYGVRFKMSKDGFAENLEETRATVLFKSAREVLFNVVKHAEVRDAFLSISREDGNVKIVVEDRGKGFPSLSAEAVNASDGLGLFGVRERLRDIGGELHIASRPGVFTRVTILAPLA